MRQGWRERLVQLKNTDYQQRFKTLCQNLRQSTEKLIARARAPRSIKSAATTVNGTETATIKKNGILMPLRQRYASLRERSKFFYFISSPALWITLAGISLLSSLAGAAIFYHYYSH